MSDVTRILSQIESGDPSAAEQLLPLVYEELRKLAAAKLANEKSGHTLQATALVHEAYLRLVGGETPRSYRDRSHFFSSSATAMRHILVDNQHASTGFTPQEKLVHKQDHRRLFFLLLRIVLPSEANEAIDDVQRAENLKMECVDKQRFEDAASWLQKYNYGLICLSNYVTEDLSVQPEHIQKLFVLLATESRT